MGQPSSSLAAAFSNVGHFLFHYFAAMYFTIVLAIERDWNQPYEVLMELWFPASLLIGLAALPAGRLADRWSSPGMLIVMFLGMGAAAIGSAFAETGTALMILLGGVGLFGAIYHPAGIPWVIKTSRGKPGMRLAYNGIFGGMGAAAAATVTGVLIEFLGWRAAFVVPGAVCFAVGLAMLFALWTNRIDEGVEVSKTSKSAGRRGNLKAVALLMIPMFMLGLIYNTVQNALPKLFEERMLDLLSGDIGKIGAAVGAVYAIGATMQLAGGYLADRFPLKPTYIALWMMQAPLLFIMSEYGGLPLGLAAIALAMAGTGILPAENLMLSRFAPADHQGLVFGIKFVVSFGAAPLGLFLITEVREATGAFSPLLTAYAVAAVVVVLVAMLLPKSEERQRVHPVAAE